MKKSALLTTTLLLFCFSLFLQPAVVTGQEAEKGVNAVLLGQIDGATRRIRFTGGTLIGAEKSQSFQRYDLASEQLKAQGVSQKAIEELEKQLQESVTWLEKKQKPRSGRPWAKGAQSAKAMKAKGELLSIVEVNRAAGFRRLYEFRVLTGGHAVVAKLVGNSGDEPCERLNDKCFICPDGTIKCVTSAIVGEREWWRRSYPGKGNNEDE